jgi:hypothetical protein
MYPASPRLLEGMLVAPPRSQSIGIAATYRPIALPKDPCCSITHILGRCEVGRFTHRVISHVSCILEFKASPLLRRYEPGDKENFSCTSTAVCAFQRIVGVAPAGMYVHSSCMLVTPRHTMIPRLQGTHRVRLPSSGIFKGNLRINKRSFLVNCLACRTEAVTIVLSYSDARTAGSE